MPTHKPGKSTIVAPESRFFPWATTQCIHMTRIKKKTTRFFALWGEEEDQFLMTIRRMSKSKHNCLHFSITRFQKEKPQAS